MIYLKKLGECLILFKALGEIFTPQKYHGLKPCGTSRKRRISLYFRIS
jgi:hypothetical protein